MVDSLFKKQLLISAMIIMASIAIAGIVAYVLMGDIDVLARKITDRRQAIANQAAEATTLASLKADATEAAGYSGALGELLPSQDGVIAYSGQVAKLAQQNGLTINFTFQGDAVPATDNAPGTIGFTLNTSGLLSNILAFFNALEGKSQIFFSEIDSFDISKGGSGYTAVATGKVFFK